MDKNVDDFYNDIRKSGGKEANVTPSWTTGFRHSSRNLKLAAFLFHHRWRCTFDWQVIGVRDGRSEVAQE